MVHFILFFSFFSPFFTIPNYRFVDGTIRRLFSLPSFLFPATHHPNTPYPLIPLPPPGPLCAHLLPLNPFSSLLSFTHPGTAQARIFIQEKKKTRDIYVRRGARGGIFSKMQPWLTVAIITTLSLNSNFAVADDLKSESLPSCANDGNGEPFSSCGPGFELKDSLPTTACAADPCTDNECCDPLPTCDQLFDSAGEYCGDGYDRRVGGDAIFCADHEGCDVSSEGTSDHLACCEAFATCSNTNADALRGSFVPVSCGTDYHVGTSDAFTACSNPSSCDTSSVGEGDHALCCSLDATCSNPTPEDHENVAPICDENSGYILAVGKESAVCSNPAGCF